MQNAKNSPPRAGAKKRNRAVTLATKAGDSVRTLAAMFDLTTRRVRQLAAEGVIPRAYDVETSVPRYIRYLRERAVKGDPAGADEVGASRAKLLKARARLATLEADQSEAQLLKRSDVDSAWDAIIGNIRTRVLSIPEATAPAIVYLSTAAQVAAFLTSAVQQSLDDIANIPVIIAAP